MWSILNGLVNQKEMLKISHSLASLTYLRIPWSSLSWEANSFSASQKIRHILRNPKVHYRSRKCPLPVPILNQLGPVYTSTSHFLKIHFNIILPSTPGSPKWSLSLWFTHHNPVYAWPLPYTRYVPCPSHFVSLSSAGEHYWKHCDGACVVKQNIPERSRVW